MTEAKTLDYFENLDTNKEYIIIGFPELKPLILRKKSVNPALNLKFFSLEDLENNVFGMTNIEAIKASMKFLDDDYALTKKFISYIRKGVNPDIDKRLANLKKNLIENNLCEIDFNFKHIFNDKEVIILGYIEENIELKHALKILGVRNPIYVKLEEILKPVNYNVTKFLRNDEEIRYTFIKINELLEQGISPSKIKIITDINTNYFFLKLYEKEFGLVLNMHEFRSLYDTKIAKVLEKHLEDLTAENIDEFDDDSHYFNDIKAIFDYYDFYNLKNKLLNFKAILKDYKINECLDTESIQVTSKLDYSEGNYIFLLGFDSAFYSQVNKNNDYFDDELKEKNNLNGTTVLNIEGDILYEYFLYTNNNFNIYYHENDGRNKDISFYFLKRYPDENEQVNHIFKPEVIGKDYSESIAKAYYSYYSNLKFKFFTNTEYYDLYHNYFGELPKYDSKYTKIVRESPEVIKISYTALNSYFECPFKYYCNYILGIGEFEENFFSISGQMIHRVMEHVYDEDADFDKAYDAAYLEFKDKFNKLDLCLLSKLKKSARYVFNKNNAYYKKSQIKKTYKEQYIEVYNDENKPTRKVYGFVDSILYAEFNNKRAIQIIDYKTGNTIIAPKKFKYGLNLQLPIYSYLVHNSKEFKDIPISGIYYVNFNDSRYNNFFENHFESSYSNYMKLGLTEKNLDYINLFDTSLSVSKVSETISGAKLKVDGSPTGSTFTTINFDEPILTKDGDEFSSMIEQIFDYFEAGLRMNNFEICPYHESNSSKTACEYCEFHDICFDNDEHIRTKEPLFHIKGIEYDDEGKDDA